MAFQSGWFDGSDYIETLDRRSELTTNGAIELGSRA
jgi:hypothetical protein